jgi:hypothetical protein
MNRNDDISEEIDAGEKYTNKEIIHRREVKGFSGQPFQAVGKQLIIIEMLHK